MRKNSTDTLSDAIEENPSTREPQVLSPQISSPLDKGIEALSGMSLNDVKVHFNSARPDNRTSASSQDREIPIAPGQERRLPHEAWHVVQQARGRVDPPRQKDGIINDAEELKREADVMGERACFKAQ